MVSWPYCSLHILQAYRCSARTRNWKLTRISKSAVNLTGALMTHDTRLLQRIAEQYFQGGTRQYLIELNRKRIREPKQEKSDDEPTS